MHDVDGLQPLQIAPALWQSACKVQTACSLCGPVPVSNYTMAD